MLQDGSGLPVRDLLVLAAWAAARHRDHGAGVPLGVRPQPADPVAAGPGSRGPAGRRGLLGQVPPSMLVGTGIVSVQLGARPSARLFTEIPAAAVTGLRLWTSAVIMAAIGGRGLARTLRDLARHRRWQDAAVAVAFGVTLGIMNFSIYQSFARIPLGIAVTIEFLGPLAVAVVSSRRVLDLLWVGLAGLGVALLAHGGTSLASGAVPGSRGGPGAAIAGVAFALVAAAGWAAYIMLSAATGRRFSGSSGLVHRDAHRGRSW